MTHCAIRGPLETQINSLAKTRYNIDVPNYSLEIWMPKNKDTLQYFKRYGKFYIRGLAEGDENKCWRVEATDTLSMPGVLVVMAEEYYANDFEDDKENGVVGSITAKPLKPQDDPNTYITGPGIIKPKIVNEYTYHGTITGTWSWDKKLPIKAKVEDRTIKIVWTSTYSGKFTLKCGDSEKEISVDSIF